MNVKHVSGLASCYNRKGKKLPKTNKLVQRDRLAEVENDNSGRVEKNERKKEIYKEIKK